MIRNGKYKLSFDLPLTSHNYYIFMKYIFSLIYTLFTIHLLCSGQFSNCTTSPFVNVNIAKIKTKNSITKRAILKKTQPFSTIAKINWLAKR